MSKQNSINNTNFIPMKDGPKCEMNINLTQDVVKCAFNPNPTNCIVEPLAKIVTDPCLVDKITYVDSKIMQNDPYWQHMPQGNIANAMAYSVNMGGESFTDHTGAGCELF